MMEEYLKSIAATPFEWRVSDCGTFLSGWVALRRSIVAYDNIPDYSDADSALLRWGGSFLKAVDFYCNKIGLTETQDPQLGDIAVIAALDLLAAGIKGARGWHFRTEKGVAYSVNAIAVKAWSV